MSSSIKSNILIDEFHGNTLPFNIFIKWYIYTTKAFCLLDIHGLRPLAFFNLFLMHATIAMWNNLKLFSPISKKYYYKHKAWVTVWSIISSSRMKKKKLRNAHLAIFIRNQAHVLPLYEPWPQHSQSDHNGSRLGREHSICMQGIPASCLFSHTWRKQQTHLQWSERLCILGFNVKDWKTRVTPKLITENLPRETRICKERKQQPQGKSPRCPSDILTEEMDEVGVQWDPLALWWQIPLHPHTVLLCSYHTCHTALCEGFFTSSRFEGQGHKVKAEGFLIKSSVFLFFFSN